MKTVKPCMDSTVDLKTKLMKLGDKHDVDDIYTA